MDTAVEPRDCVFCRSAPCECPPLPPGHCRCCRGPISEAGFDPVSGPVHGCACDRGDCPACDPSIEE